MNEARSILRVAGILLVMMGVLASTVTSCNAAIMKRVSQCCAGDTCDSVGVGGKQAAEEGPAQMPSKGGCTDCTVLCKTPERSMAMVGAMTGELTLAGTDGYVDTSGVIPAAEHLSGVFKPPKG